MTFRRKEDGQRTDTIRELRGYAAHDDTPPALASLMLEASERIAELEQQIANAFCAAKEHAQDPNKTITIMLQRLRKEG